MPIEQQKYNSDYAKTKYDAIIIGSGIGGLCAGALLSKAGKKVLILEKHYVAGGFTHTFSRKGYEWDVGLHYVGDVHRKNSLLRRVLDYISNNQLQWAPMTDVYDRMCFEDQCYDYVAGRQNFRDKICEYFPNEVQAIDRYLEAIRAVVKASKNYYTLKALPPIVETLSGGFLNRQFYKYSDQTTKNVILKFTNNQKLLGVLTGQYGDYGLPPAQSSFAMHAMLVHHYMNGGNYPVGGSSSFAKTIIPVIEESGGKVLVRAGVKEILIRNNKAIGVQLENGDEIFSDTIISNAGVHNTFQRFIPESCKTKQKLNQEANFLKPSFSHICLYIGFKGTTEELDFKPTNYWIYPGYDHDKSLADYQNDPSSPLPVAYVSFPSTKDPSWESRYPGRSTIEVIGFAPYDWFKKWEDTEWHRRGEDYNDFKEKLSQRLLDRLYQYIPQVKGKIDYYELSTPLSTRHFANYEHGEIYGIEHSPKRFRQKWLRPNTAIQNLYLTGQDIVTDGIAGALFSGVLTTSYLLKKNLIKDFIPKS